MTSPCCALRTSAADDARDPRPHCAGDRRCAASREGYTPFRPGAGRAHDDGRRRPQRAARADRPGVARACRLLRDRRLHGGDPDASTASSFWIAFPLAGVHRRAIGAAARAARVAGELGPISRWSRIAFAFIVQHGTIEWRDADRRPERPDGNSCRRALGGQCRLPSARWRCSRSCWRVVSLLPFPSPCAKRLGQGDGGGARLPRPPRARSGSIRSSIKTDGVRALGVFHRARWRRLRAVDDVRRARIRFRSRSRSCSCSR